MDENKYISADKVRNKCIGCDVDKLKDKLNYIKKDFK